ncbi:MAG: heme-copper oxidase subunit III [Terriglobia bacterium]
MAGKTATEELELIDVEGTGAGPPGGGGDFGHNGGEGGAAAPALPQRIYVTGIWLALAAILMFFMALTSSFIVRKGLSNDWAPFAFPRILWFNTGVLLASSFTIERARRLLAQEPPVDFRRWWNITTALGLVFLIGQLVAWGQLRAAGVYLANNPSNSFFYLLTATHGIHLLGGMVALLWVGFRRWPEDARVSLPTAATISSLYWQFLDGRWIFLFLLLWLEQ